MRDSRILVQLSHPAHVHFFKNFIKECEDRGAETDIIARDKEIVCDLLNHYGFSYETILSLDEDGSVGAIDQLRYDLSTRNYIRDFDPDVITSIGGTAASHASLFTDTTSVIFTDTENAVLQNLITFPFTDVICIPDCYQKRIRYNHVQYPGYHELAYLHPNRFTPDPSVLDLIDADKDEKIVVMRLVSWQALHDIGDSGFDDVVNVVSELERTGARVIITSQAELPNEIERCRSTVPPHKMHDLMHYSDLFIGESATMAAESAVLGTPAIFVSSNRRGYTDELDDIYELVFNFSGSNRQQRGLKKALSILNAYNPNIWEQRRANLLEDKMDTTEFMISQVKESL